MLRLGNPLVYDLLDVAEALAEQRGRRNLEKAAMRRAVSSAYYSVFHGFCFICVRALGVWTRDATLVEPVYRLLDHGQVRKRLGSREAAELGSVIVGIGAAFADLQDRRHKADYSPPGLDVSRDTTRIAVARARKTIADLESLDDDQCRRLSRFRKSGSRFCDKNLRQNKKLSGRSVGLPTQVCLAVLLITKARLA